MMLRDEFAGIKGFLAITARSSTDTSDHPQIKSFVGISGAPKNQTKRKKIRTSTKCRLGIATEAHLCVWNLGRFKTTRADLSISSLAFGPAIPDSLLILTFRADTRSYEVPVRGAPALVPDTHRGLSQPCALCAWTNRIGMAELWQRFGRYAPFTAVSDQSRECGEAQGGVGLPYRRHFRRA